MDQRYARLRICASCKWIFKRTEKTEEEGCPKCGFGHYGARFVYGNRAYKYAKSQTPWIEKRMSEYLYQLRKEIEDF